MEYCITYTHDPAVLAWPSIGRWRLVCIVADKHAAGQWVIHWERIG